MRTRCLLHGRRAGSVCESAARDVQYCKDTQTRVDVRNYRTVYMRIALSVCHHQCRIVSVCEKGNDHFDAAARVAW